LMYRLNVQVTAYGRQTVPDSTVVRSTIISGRIFADIRSQWYLQCLRRLGRSTP